MHLVVFYLKKNSPAEANYENYDKDLMAIVRAFDEWRAEPKSVEIPIQVLLDHKNPEYLMSNKNLRKRQAPWANYLSPFNFQITNLSGKKNTKPDTLTMRSRDLPCEGNERYKNVSTMIKQHNNICLYA